MDIKLVNGDLALDIEGDVIVEDNSTSLLLRALKTPKEYIARFVLDSLGIYHLDEAYGNAIYQRLSEGITSDLLTQIKLDVEEAGSFAPVEILSVSVLSFLSDYTVNVGVDYKLQEEIKTLVTRIVI